MAKEQPRPANPFCPVPRCGTTAPHTDDPIVAGLMQVFSPPESLALWSLASMADLRDSILADLEANRFFAYQTRLRQVEEIYIRALYCLFIATEEELPHIFAGAMPNSIVPMYRKVNNLILGGRAVWEVSQQGESFGHFTPLDVLHSSAHASYVAMYTAIAVAKSQTELKLDGYMQHLETYCNRLDYMYGMFKQGRGKEDVLSGIIAMHRPASYWQSPMEG